MRNSVFRTVAMMRWVVVLACSCEDCAAAIPIALAPTTATPIATAKVTNWLVLRGMIASTSRLVVADYQPFDACLCDGRHSLANFAAATRGPACCRDIHWRLRAAAEDLGRG